MSQVHHHYLPHGQWERDCGDALLKLQDFDSFSDAAKAIRIRAAELRKLFGHKFHPAEILRILVNESLTSRRQVLAMGADPWHLERPEPLTDADPDPNV